jgi:hypothetical protein
VSRPGWGTYVRDTIIFAVGLAIVLKQAGIGFAAPEGGPSIELIILGGLFCNGPVMIQALSLRFGTGSPSSPPPPPVPASPSPPSSAPPSGGS